MSIPPADRQAFIAERRAVSARRFDTLHSPRYDEEWGEISRGLAGWHGDRRGLRYRQVLARAATTRPGSAPGWLAAAGFATADEADARLLLRTRENHVPLGKNQIHYPERTVVLPPGTSFHPAPRPAPGRNARLR